jgi:hypothetical protein
MTTRRAPSPAPCGAAAAAAGGAGAGATAAAAAGAGAGTSVVGGRVSCLRSVACRNASRQPAAAG